MSPTQRPTIVMKFGGTSVADADGRQSLVARVRDSAADNRLILVVSAMGRSGNPYATDTLLGLVEGLPANPRETDKLAACGEIISTVVVAQTLQDAGIPARSLSGAEAGILTDDSHGGATVVAIDPERITDTLEAGEIPVIAGFQGMSRDGSLTTLGRGGSDTTACVIAAAVGADSVEIYTDVEGVMTADPRELPEARVVDAMEFQELFQMARHGSRVVYAPAAEAAMEAGVPLRVRSTFSGAPGTLVGGDAGHRSRKVGTAVTHVDHVTRIRISLPEDDMSADHMQAQTRVFRAMAGAGVSLDMFTPFGDALVFSLADGQVPDAVATLDRLELPYEIETGLAKVTLVGAAMHGVPGVMARLAEALAAADVTIRQIADSHVTISVLVCQNVRHKAVSALHSAFGLGEDVTEVDDEGRGRTS